MLSINILPSLSNSLIPLFFKFYSQRHYFLKPSVNRRIHPGCRGLCSKTIRYKTILEWQIHRKHWSETNWDHPEGERIGGNDWNTTVLTSCLSQLCFLQSLLCFVLLGILKSHKVFIKGIRESNGVSWRVSEELAGGGLSPESAGTYWIDFPVVSPGSWQIFSVTTRGMC